MNYAAGTRLGAYEIQSLVGAGGMGEVYKARDTRLDRTVAIKILPPALAADPHFRERFDREARAISALEHPHICPLYDVGNEQGTSFLVMQYLDGDTLADRLAQGPLPVEQAFQLAGDIAGALETAHRHGIVHRDLKPANIKITNDGAKVLDFGLAKDLSASSAALSMSPTLSVGATQAGVILGTAAYMSPEQARGQTVDTRADIWAFGCVLYEMLTGCQAFGASTLTDTIAAIVKSDPDWTLLPPAIPSGIARVLRRCLDKDLRERFHHIADVRIDLVDARAALSPPLPGSIGRASWRRLAGVAAGGALIGAVVVASIGRLVARPAAGVSRAERVVRLTLPLGDRQTLAGARDAPLGVGRPSIAISPDGRSIAYVGVVDRVPRLYVRALDAPDVRQLPGTEGAFNPFFSPDGQWIGFFSDIKLKKVSLLGGEPIILCDARNPYGASWGDDDTIVFGDSEATWLVRAPAAGGPVQRVTHIKKGYAGYGWPDVLPGSRAALVSTNTPQGPRVVWVSLESDRSHEVLAGFGARYVAPGYLVFVRDGTLMAASFDPTRGAAGQPIPLIDRIRGDDFAWQFAVSHEGSLVFATGSMSATAGTLTWVDRQGAAIPVGAPPRAYGTFRVSPDGDRLVFLTVGQTTDVWTYDFSRSASARLTTAANNWSPVWTRDGHDVVFGSDRGGAVGLFSQRADGSREAERIASVVDGAADEWSPDGSVLAFEQLDVETGFDIWLLPSNGNRAPRPFLKTPFQEWGARFAPDGRWIAYVSDESGRYEVYVRPYPGPGERYQISSDGGEEPVWHPGSRELFYRNGQKWMAVAVTLQPRFSVQTPQLMFEGPYINVPGPSYDISHDGTRFLLIKGEDQPAATSLQVVTNWLDDVRRRVR